MLIPSVGVIIIQDLDRGRADDFQSELLQRQAVLIADFRSDFGNACRAAFFSGIENPTAPIADAQPCRIMAHPVITGEGSQQLGGFLGVRRIRHVPIRPRVQAKRRTQTRTPDKLARALECAGILLPERPGRRVPLGRRREELPRVAAALLALLVAAHRQFFRRAPLRHIVPDPRRALNLPRVRKGAVETNAAQTGQPDAAQRLKERHSLILGIRLNEGDFVKMRVPARFAVSHLRGGNRPRDVGFQRPPLAALPQALLSLLHRAQLLIQRVGAVMTMRQGNHDRDDAAERAGHAQPVIHLTAPNLADFRAADRAEPRRSAGLKASVERPAFRREHHADARCLAILLLEPPLTARHAFSRGELRSVSLEFEPLRAQSPAFAGLDGFGVRNLVNGSPMYTKGPLRGPSGRPLAALWTACGGPFP